MLPSGDSMPSPWSLVGQMAIQLVVMSQLGALGSSIDATIPFMGNVHGSASFFAVPLLLTAVSIAVLFLGGRYAAKRSAAQTSAGIWIQAAVTGLVFTLLVNIVGAIFAMSVPVPSVKISPIGAVTFGSFVFALVIGTLATSAGRASVRPRATAGVGVRAAVRRAFETVAVHYGVFLAIAIPVVVLVLGIKSGWQATLSSPLWAPTAGLFMFGLGHLSALSRTWNFGSPVASSANSSGSDISFGFGSALSQYGIPGWAGGLLLLLALISIVVASVFWYLRRGPVVTNKITDWVMLPAAFLMAGTLMTWLSSVTGTFDAGSLASGAGSMTLAWWTPFFLMLWGGATEASARYVAPQLSRYVPLAMAYKIAPADPTVTAPAATASTAAAAPASYAAPGAHPALAPREPMSAQTKRKLGLILGSAGLVVVLVVGGVIALNVIKGNNGPDKTVSSYLQALQNGEASKAMALADPGLANDQRVLLSDEVYAKAGKRIDGFDIVSTKVSDDKATVVADVHQDGRKQQTTFSLRKSNPELLDDHWKMESTPLQSVRITSDTAVQKVLINGQELDVDLAGSSLGSSGFSYPAFPGEYTVELPSSEKYLTAKKSMALVTIGAAQAPPTASLKVDASDALKSEAMAQIDAYLAECVKSTEAEPANCPLNNYASSRYSRNFHWTLTTKPTFTMSKDPYGSSPWRISTQTPGKATVTYEKDNSYGFGTADWKPTTDTTSVSMSAKVSLENGKVKLTYSKY
ncbi:YrzE family protein [Pseudarthrobacter sp. alpha12b]